MANHTLLDCVNEILKRVNVVDTSNTGVLTSLTQSNVQHNINIAVQIVNEGIDQLYTEAEVDLPLRMAESTITLLANTREYALASNLIKLKWPFRDLVNSQYLSQWLDSYENLLLIDPQQTMTGLPQWGMISPITGLLRLEFAPETQVQGHVYNYDYEKDTLLALATDTVPFNNQVFRAMVPAWVQLYKREMRNEFDQSLYTQAVGRASRSLTEEPLRMHYSPRG